MLVKVKALAVVGEQRGMEREAGQLAGKCYGVPPVGFLMTAPSW